MCNLVLSYIGFVVVTVAALAAAAYLGWKMFQAFAVASGVYPYISRIKTWFSDGENGVNSKLSCELEALALRVSRLEKPVASVPFDSSSGSLTYVRARRPRKKKKK